MKSQRRRTLVSIFVWSFGVLAAPMVTASAQEPVNKPASPTVGTGARLAAPRNIAAVQLSDGRIRVTWSPVTGATSYAIVRSVPPEAARSITPNVTDTVYFDSDITAGKTYYYVISGLNETATGMRQGSAPLKATRGFDPSASHLTPTDVVARYDSASRMVSLSWRAPLPATFLIERDGVQVGRVDRAFYSVAAAAPGTRMQFRVRTQDAQGVQSPWATSNEVLIPASSAASGDTPTGTPALPSGPTSTTGPAGTVAVTIGSALTMRVGASASATSALGGASASRWASLDEGIATVDASGTVSARAAGRARLLAIAGAADGSVRVTLVQVTVSP